MTKGHSSHAVQYVPFQALTPSSELIDGLDRIFFEASSVRVFASDCERARFRDRWLGRFLRLFPENGFVALAPEDDVVGYVVGCLDDPARCALFEDIGYFPAFSDLTALYRAHLHINVCAGWRGGGIGEALIDRFAGRAREQGCAGVHIVTSEGARNVRFYNRLGFVQRRRLVWRGKTLVFLGRDLCTGPSGRLRQ